MAKKKYICAGCNKCTEPCTVELSGDADMTKDPAKMLHCGTWVEVPTEESTDKEQRPKLTTEVFSMEECPDWAQYAAVDANGFAYWYDEKPLLLLDEWVSTGTHFARRITQNNTMTRLRYDSSDWKNSCIERLVENQLPKLTLKVFATNECPEWAQYAAVDSDGVAYWYADKPELNRSLRGWSNTGEHNVQRLTLYYDSTDWEHSLIEHPDTNRPALTHTVFILSDTPAWAQYAAVDAYGTAHWFSAEPVKPAASDHVWKPNGCSCHASIPGAFAARNWRDSCIRRKHIIKLTEEIFDHPECPDDAVVAVVNDDGTAAWGNRADITLSGNGSFKAAGYSDYNTWTTIPGGACFDTTDWQHSAVHRAGTQQGTGFGLLALTRDVFSYSTLNEWKYVMRNYVERGRTYTGCPDWARYAAVNEDGAAYVYEFAPVPLGEAWAVSCGRYAIVCGADKHELKFDASDWRNSLIELSKSEQLPKLTVEAFSLPQCPKWAQYAAVDEDGIVCYYTNEPNIRGGRWEPTIHGKVQTLYDEHHQYIRYDATDWQHSLIGRLIAVPKLTHDVFSMEECPKWAKYAAVDADGVAYWYEVEPKLCTVAHCWDSIGLRARRLRQPGSSVSILFDADDWKNSLIKRPAAVPAWFKPGVLAYNNDTHTCFHVTASTEYRENYLEAKVRPFSADELERKLGQFVLGPNGSKLLVTGYCAEGRLSGLPVICVLGNKWLTAEELLTYGSRPQGIKQYRSKEGTWIDCGLSS